MARGMRTKAGAPDEEYRELEARQAALAKECEETRQAISEQEQILATVNARVDAVGVAEKLHRTSPESMEQGVTERDGGQANEAINAKLKDIRWAEKASAQLEADKLRVVNRSPVFFREVHEKTCAVAAADAQAALAAVAKADASSKAARKSGELYKAWAARNGHSWLDPGPNVDFEPVVMWLKSTVRQEGWTICGPREVGAVEA